MAGRYLSEGKELTIPDLDVVRPDGTALSKPCEETVDLCAVCHVKVSECEKREPVDLSVHRRSWRFGGHQTSNMMLLRQASHQLL